MKTFLQKAIFQISSKVVFFIKKVKNNVPWTCAIGEIIELKRFTKKSCKNKSERVQS